MESESAQPPLKICPRCAVASRTVSETCPECGRRYRRRRWPALAVVIVAAAFGVGYGGRLLLDGGDDKGITEVTLVQVRGVPLGISHQQLSQRLGGALPVTTRTRPSGRERCLFYAIASHPNDAWAFCFRQDKLVVSTLGSALSAQ
jgi:hypothetical protein